MRKKGKVLNLICGVLVFITCFSIACNHANANNNSDSPWSYTLSVQDSSYHFVQQRKKEDDTYVYVRWSDKTGTLKALNLKVYGDGVDCGTQNKGVSHTYYISHTGRYSLVNYVFENGCSMCKVGFKSNDGYGVAQGVWSPDSIGTYTVIY